MSAQVVNIKYWQAQSLAASVNGPALPCPANGRLSAAFTWTGTPTGTIALQCRMAGGTFATVPGASTEFTSQPAGSAVSTPLVVNFDVVPGGEYRFIYTHGGSTGTITCNVAQGDSQET